MQKGTLHFKENVTGAIGWFIIILFSFSLSIKVCVTSASSKTLCNHFKKARPSAPKFPENLKNILGAGGWREPNIFPITALVRSYKTSIILQLIMITVAAIKVWKLLSVRNHILKSINWFANQSIYCFLWYKFLLKGISRKTIVELFFKNMLIFKKQSNIDSLTF